MSDCKHDGRMKKYVDLLLGDHVLRWKCAKCNERFSPTAAAHADGIEAARRAVEDAGWSAALVAIATLTADAPEATTWDTCHEHADGCDGCTNQKCYRCGLPACLNEDCSSVVPYYHYGSQRLCDDCNIEYTEDIKRVIGQTDDASEGDK